MTRLERDTTSRWLDDRRTVITRDGGSWLYDVDGNRVPDGSFPAATREPAAIRLPSATREPGLPPPDPDLPGGPSPTDPEGPTDPKPDEPTDPTGPDEPPAVGVIR